MTHGSPIRFKLQVVQNYVHKENFKSKQNKVFFESIWIPLYFSIIDFCIAIIDSYIYVIVFRFI